MNGASLDCSKVRDRTWCIFSLPQSNNHAGVKPIQQAEANTNHSKTWEARSRGRNMNIDPFALKISIPPLVLLAYVFWKSRFREDSRLRYIREAEEKHSTYMASEEAERTTLESLSSISVKKI